MTPIEQSIATETIKQFIIEFKEIVKPLITDLSKEIKHFFDDGLYNYLVRSATRFSNVKTILHRVTPVNFYDIYQPLSVSAGKNKITPTKIDDLFKESNYITVIGEAGSGKSTLTKHLFLTAINEKSYIPVLIELRYLDEYQKTCEEYFKEKIFENKITDASNIFERMLRQGRFLIFLDGYDEIKSQSKPKTTDLINNFISKYPENKYFITSRPHSDIELLPLFINMDIAPFEHQEVIEFIRKQKIEDELVKKIIRTIQDTKYSYFKSFLSNPLLLSLYILTYKTNSEVPNKKYIFYRRVLDVLFKEHDSITKLGYQREIKSKLSQESIEDILKIFSFLTYCENKFYFEKDYTYKKLNQIKSAVKNLQFGSNEFIDDMRISICLWIDDGGVLSFAHRSIQEYLAVLYIQTFSDKEAIYSKVLSKILHIRSNEVNNLLTLALEMDEFYFKKYIYLPALQKLVEYLNHETEEDLIFKVATARYNSAIMRALDVPDNYTAHTKLYCNGLYIHHPLDNYSFIIDFLNVDLWTEVISLLDSNDFQEKIFEYARPEYKTVSRGLDFDFNLITHKKLFLENLIAKYPDIYAKASEIYKKVIDELHKTKEDMVNYRNSETSVIELL